MIRRATKEDIKVIEGLFDFIKSLEIDILKDYSEEKIFKILEYVFSSEYDRFSYKNEVLEEEFYLDTLFVFSDARGEGIGNKLLTEFVNSGEAKLSLNVAQSNNRARKLYESYGFKKECEIFIGHENYDHLIRRK